MAEKVGKETYCLRKYVYMCVCVRVYVLCSHTLFFIKYTTGAPRRAAQGPGGRHRRAVGPPESAGRGARGVFGVGRR